MFCECVNNNIHEYIYLTNLNKHIIQSPRSFLILFLLFTFYILQLYTKFFINLMSIKHYLYVWKDDYHIKRKLIQMDIWIYLKNDDK